MKRRFYILLSLLFYIALQPLWAKKWSADNIPMVHLTDARRYVCDPENLMQQAWRDSTDIYLHRLEKEKGVQTVMVVVGKVEDGDAFRVAQDIGNKYGVGNKKTNRGLVVVVAVDNRRYFIAPGEGLEDEITDLECDKIARKCIVHYMRMGNIDQAMASTAKALYSQFKTGNTGLDEAEDDTAEIIILILLAFCFFTMIIYIYSSDKDNENNNGKGGKRKRSDMPFIIWGNPGHINDRSFGGGFGGGFSGGSFGGGSFGGGGAGGGW